MANCAMQAEQHQQQQLPDYLPDCLLIPCIWPEDEETLFQARRTWRQDRIVQSLRSHSGVYHEPRYTAVF